MSPPLLLTVKLWEESVSIFLYFSLSPHCHCTDKYDKRMSHQASLTLWDFITSQSNIEIENSMRTFPQSGRSRRLINTSPNILTKWRGRHWESRQSRWRRTSARCGRRVCLPGRRQCSCPRGISGGCRWCPGCWCWRGHCWRVTESPDLRPVLPTLKQNDNKIN